MFFQYAILIRLGLIALTIITSIVLIIVSFFTKNKKRAITFRILPIVLIATVSFFMFLFGTYVKVDKLKEESVEKIWTAFNEVDYSYDSFVSSLTDWDIYAYTYDSDEYSIFIQKWTTTDEVDMDYWCEAINFPINGLDSIYYNMKYHDSGEKFEWVVTPLYACKSACDLYAFSGYYDGDIIIRQDNTYIRCEYSIKTSQSTLAAFTCIPPINFDIVSLLTNNI